MASCVDILLQKCSKLDCELPVVF